MRRRRGMTLVELLIGLIVLGFVTVGTMGLMVFGMQAVQRTNSDSNLQSDNAQAVRQVAETLRRALTVTVSPDGTRIDYVLPRQAAISDAVTGERELMFPLQGDGVNRAFVVNFANGTLTQIPGNRVLLRNINRTDPLPGSSQFNQQYQPFSVTTIGSMRAITVNLIALEDNQGERRFVRFKTTAAVRNAR